MQYKWWHDKVVYQIYPKSFMDSNGDGIGDLRGIIGKLDYLKELGIDIIWLSPVYQSPFVDQGYDISDYYRIAEEFGTMEEFDELLWEVKKRGMYLIMDLVVNHCSDQHEFFQRALEDPDGEYADYFYFVKGKDGGAPSNYRSYFGGSAWEKIPGSDKYYLHFFAKEQPDWNWENEKTRRYIYDMINWWLDKGVAGFRVDAIINIKKDTRFPSYEPDGADGLVHCTKMVESVDGVGAFLEEMKRETFARKDAFTVGEVFNMKEDELREFIGEDGHFSSMFDFCAEEFCTGEHGWYDAREITLPAWKQAVFRSQMETEGIGFKSNIIENHDEPRGFSRFLPKHLQNDNGAKALGTVNILLKGIPFIYQGQEIGMRNCPMESIEEYDDISTKDQYQVALDAGLTEEQALLVCRGHSRDNARTPMQWSAQANAGFTTGTPWLKIHPDYIHINVEKQEKEDDSILHYYQKLIALRKHPAWKEIFVYGKTVPVYEDSDCLFAYERVLGNESIQVVANFGICEAQIECKSEILLSNLSKVQQEEQSRGSSMALLPGQVLVWK